MTPEEIRQKATEIYEAPMCGGSGGCCTGDFEGAMSFIMGEIDEIETAAYSRGLDAEALRTFF